MFSPDKAIQEQENPVVEQQSATPLTKADLKEKYEGPYRHEQAGHLMRKREEIRSSTEKLRNHLKKPDIRITSIEEVTQNKEAAIIGENEYYKRELASLQVSRDQITTQQNSRSYLDKIKFRFAHDPLSDMLQTIEASEKDLQAKLQVNVGKVDVLHADLQKELQRVGESNRAALEGVERGHITFKKDLLEETRRINQRSLSAIRDTFESMEQGDLAIDKLAVEANALVVHTLPIEGWSMKNTSGNNQEVDTLTMSSHDKIAMIQDKQPDISASVITAGEKIKGQEVMYPFGLIVDGSLVASYETDSGTVADGTVRRKKEGEQTLIGGVKDLFAKVANQSTPSNYPWNESVVHNPQIKGVLIDEGNLTMDYAKGDEVTEYFSPDQEDEILKKYGDTIVASGKGVPTFGEYVGKSVFKIKRKRTGMEKALEYATTHYSQYPVYIRKTDGIYDMSGTKVNAADIYK
jgi:hypothetical protein